MFVFASLVYIASTWHLFLHLTLNAAALHLHGACSYSAHAPMLFLHCKFSYFPLTFFCIILFFCVLICSWNQCLVVSLILLFYLCKFWYSFVLALHVSNFLGLFLFHVLCKCNLFGFYITLIISVSFFFSFLSFVVYFILFIMSTTMKKVCNGGSTNLVLEVLKNILPITSVFSLLPNNC
jgi:hypothetical protein